MDWIILIFLIRMNWRRYSLVSRLFGKLPGCRSSARRIFVFGGRGIGKSRRLDSIGGN